MVWLKLVFAHRDYLRKNLLVSKFFGISFGFDRMFYFFQMILFEWLDCHSPAFGGLSFWNLYLFGNHFLWSNRERTSRVGNHPVWPSKRTEDLEANFVILNGTDLFSCFTRILNQTNPNYWLVYLLNRTSWENEPGSYLPAISFGQSILEHNMRGGR